MTTARIDARFAALKAEGRAGFVAYVMAGDPSRDEALQILRGLPAAGADLIELGFPFSDPMAEGPPIQRAASSSASTRTPRSASHFSSAVAASPAAAESGLRQSPTDRIGVAIPVD